MSSARTTKAKRPVKRLGAKISVAPRHDWRKADAMSDAEVLAAARADPDAQPLSSRRGKAAKRAARVNVIRQALGLSQEAFAERFGIPVGTLRDWEQGRADPDAAARSYLAVIARDPAAVARALEKGG